MIRVTGSRVFLDSSAWLGYFLGNTSQTRNIIDSESTLLLTSIISFHEVFKRLKNVGKTEKQARAAITFIEESGIIVNVSKEIALNAVNYGEKYELHTIDSLLYASAMKAKATFITLDKDFQKTPKTRIITNASPR